MTNLITNYNNVLSLDTLSVEPKTEPTPLTPVETPVQASSHQLLKQLLKHVKRQDWVEAKKLYQDIPHGEREVIEKLVFNRALTIDPDTSIEYNTINTVINESFEALITPNSTNQDIPSFDFFIHFFVPSVSDYLINTYEFEENEAVTKIAKEAIKGVQEKLILMSPNNAKQNNVLMNFLASQKSSNLKYDYIIWVDKLFNYLDSFRDLQKIFIQKQPKMNPFLTVNYCAQMHEDFHFGNCGEKSYCTFKKLNNVNRVEPGYIVNGDHHFDIVNRSKDSSRTDFRTWGRRCMVVDSWTDETNGPNVYPAYDIPIYLKDYEALDADRNPILHPFDESTQNVGLCVSNMYTTSDLYELFSDTSEDRQGIKWLKNELKKFEEASSKEDKSIIANEIISKAPKLKNDSNKKVAKTLISQLKSYLNADYAELFNVGPKINRPIFECLPCNGLFANYLCSTTVDHLLKITDLYREGKIDKAEKKFEKLTDDMKRELDDQFSKLSQNMFFDGDFASLHPRSQVIYVYLIDKMMTATANQKHEVARKIFNKFPKNLQEYISVKI